MSFQKALLEYSPIRDALSELDRLQKGSEYERAASEYFLERSIRKAFGLTYQPENQESIALCKAEMQQNFPNASTQEIDAMTKARNEVIEQKTIEIVANTKAIIEIFTMGLVAEAKAKFIHEAENLFSDHNIDALLSFKISQLPDSTQKAILEKFYENRRKRE